MSSRLHPDSRGGFAVLRSKRRFTDSSFSIAAPSAWNYLPSNIRTSKTLTLFLSKLKARLFASSFAILYFIYILYSYCCLLGVLNLITTVCRRPEL